MAGGTGRLAALERRIDDLVSVAAREQVYGKRLYSEFNKHCADDEARHRQNLGRLDGIEAAMRDHAEAMRAHATAVEKAMAAQAAAHEKLAETFHKMLPMLRRIQSREVFRRAALLCLRRWKAGIVGFGVTVAALFVWLDGHGPRLVACARWLLKQLGGH